MTLSGTPAKLIVGELFNTRSPNQLSRRTWNAAPSDVPQLNSHAATVVDLTWHVRLRRTGGVEGNEGR